MGATAFLGGIAANFTGAVLAVGQGVVIARLGVPFLRWSSWSLGGWLLGNTLFGRFLSPALGGFSTPLARDMAISAAAFAVLGGAQTAVLRGFVTAAGWWVPASAGGGAAIILLAVPVRLAGFSPIEAGLGVPAAEGAVAGLIGLAYGGLTGFALSWLASLGREPAMSRPRTRAGTG